MESSCGENDLIAYLRILYRYRWMIFIFVVLSIIIAAISAHLKPEKYEATATFFPINLREYYDGAVETVSLKRQLYTEDLVISILESREMADRIIDQLNLQNLWNKKSKEASRVKIKKITRVTIEKRGLIKLSVKTRSPEFSAKIANAYVDNLDYFNQKLNLGAQRQIVQVIDKAVVPEKSLPRKTKQMIILATISSVMFGIFLAFTTEFFRKNNILKQLKGD